MKIFMAVLLLLSVSKVALAQASNHRQRWEVKTLSDGFIPSDTAWNTSVAEQCRLEHLPAHVWKVDLPRREDESRTCVVRCRIDSVKLESDGDYHLVISGGDSSMIAEIPDSATCNSKVWGKRFAAARKVVDSLFGGKRLGTITKGHWSHRPSVHAIITGIGFWDKKHDRATGHAGNWREIHPVLEVRLRE